MERHKRADLYLVVCRPASQLSCCSRHVGSAACTQGAHVTLRHGSHSLCPMHVLPDALAADAARYLRGPA